MNEKTDMIISKHKPNADEINWTAFSVYANEFVDTFEYESSKKYIEEMFKAVLERKEHNVDVSFLYDFKKEVDKLFTMLYSTCPVDVIGEEAMA